MKAVSRQSSVPGPDCRWSTSQNPGPRTQHPTHHPSLITHHLFAAVLALALLLGTAGSAAAETRPHYDLQVAVAWAEGSVDVVQRTSFRNDTGAALSEVVFQVVPAYFGAFSLSSASVDGAEVRAALDGTVLEVALPAPLAPDAECEVELRYRLAVPEMGGRFGRGGGIMALGNFFPALAPYRDGWDRHQYVDVGDAFFTEVADFDVALSVDAPVEVAASAPADERGDARFFHAESVRDFALAISSRYQVRAREAGGVRIAAYATSASRLDAYLDAAADALAWYSSRFAPYPYPSLAIAEIHADDMTPTAMEYPGLIMTYGPLGADGGGAGSYSEYVIAHEVGHQWFYSLVGDDEVRDPWLDEALATYTDLLFLRDRAPWAFQSYWQRNVAIYRNRAAAGGDRPVNTTVYDYPSDGPYFDIVYRKGAVFLDGLRELMGDEAFFGLLREYVRTYSHKVATPRAFLDMAYERAGADFPPLAARYFTYGAFADGAGYHLEVAWPERLSPGGAVAVSFASSFGAAEARLWLDGRLLYAGPAAVSVDASLEGVEEGEYVLQLDLIDDEGALYQRARRVAVR